MADTRMQAPVRARRAAEHPERPLVIGIGRRGSSAVVAAPAPRRPASRDELEMAVRARDGTALPHGPVQMETAASVPTGRFTDPAARVWDAGMTGMKDGKGWTLARHTMADHTIPDLDRLSDAFPMTSSGKAGRRELERAHALDSTVTSGA